MLCNGGKAIDLSVSSFFEVKCWRRRRRRGEYDEVSIENWSADEQSRGEERECVRKLNAGNNAVIRFWRSQVVKRTNGGGQRAGDSIHYKITLKF